MTRLPAALAPWAGVLAALSPELALAMGPLLRHLDTLIGGHEPVAELRGAPEGLGGLGRSGPPERLTASEWLLAEEYPEEFLRRLVEGELLYLEPEFSAPAVRGRMVAVVDAGPTQAGAGRLVQLAALLVLHRRAAARGTELVVTVLGDQRPLAGDLAELLPAWLAARRPADPTPAEVADALAALDADDRAWVLTSPRLAERIPARPGVLTSEPAHWTAEGAGRVMVRIDGTSAELPLPAGPIAVRALRGAEFRRAAPARPARPQGAADLPTAPAFTSDARTLLARGADPAVLFAVNLPSQQGSPGGIPLRMRRHQLPGPVLAAGRTGRRLIALCVEGERLTAHSVGRSLGEPGRYFAELATFCLEAAELERMLAGPVLPVIRQGEELEVPLGIRWWRLGPDGRVADFGSTGPGTRGRSPFVRARDPRLFAGQVHEEARGLHHYLHSGGSEAWSHDSRTWELRTAQGERHRIAFREQAEVIGLVHGERPALITLSAAGHVVRCLPAGGGSRTLTRFSGGTGTPVVHPTRPLIAAETRPGRIVIGDASTGRVQFVIGGVA
ncbi:hypothetical protein ACIRBX_05025 [Kitasatospora sp. NPDC096147]|uniref:hypothetical protein n=1 Tax=Kitasatospora sp. NPDC096147 TaxID=3364093 RepID=UPI00382354C8